MTDKNIYRRKEPQNDEQDTEYQGIDSDGDSPLDNEMEQVIGREVDDKPEPVNRQPQVRVVYRDRPAAPRGPGPVTFQERPLPARMMGASIPELTNASRMMSKPPAAMSLFPKSSSGASMMFPKAKAMSFNIPMPLGQKGSMGDPFRGLAGFDKKKKLPVGMRMFAQPKAKGRRKFL